MAARKLNVEQQQLDLNIEDVYSGHKADTTPDDKEKLVELGKKAFEENTQMKKKTRKSKAEDLLKEVEEIQNGNISTIKTEEKQENKKVVEEKQEEIQVIKDDIIIPEKKVEEVKIDPENIIENSTIERFDVTKESGLNDAQVNQRILEGNVNSTGEKVGKSTFQIICSNLFTFFNMLYLIITILLIYVKSYTNLFYLVIVIPNIIIGIYQEIKARNMVRKLTLVSASKANVVRNGVHTEINASEVVIDDVVIFTNGNQIYSDAIVMDGLVEVNESMITGESDAIQKKPGDFLYSGSFVSSGTAIARIENVGKNNYIEKLSSEAKKQKGRKSELLRTLNWIIRVIGFIIVPIFIIQIIRAYSANFANFAIGTLVDIGKDDAGEAITYAISSSYDQFFYWFSASIKKISGSIIGMIPAGLFLLTSVALFTAIWRLGKNNNTLVQESYCIEMLARVDTLCLDKTGTITDGTMRVVDCVEIENKTDYSIREIIGSMMNAFEDSNATSDAIIRFFSKNSVLEPEAILPFSSKRKFSAVTFKGVGTFYLGAPEFILIDNYKKVQTKIERYASQGCRVLTLGYTSTGIKKEGIASNVKPFALIVIQDHIRDDAPATIDFFKNNDVDIKVISGDNPITVSEIARRVGIPNAQRYISLEGLSDDEVKELAFDYTVFGRVTPSQKKALVVALKEGKRTVAMTGDGVNDILAMKESDCSIAMASGCEATKTIANLVLMDSNFASMPAVVAEGRRVINNIQRTSTLFLVKTLFTIFLTIFYLAIGQDYIFEPSQLILIETIIVGIPAAIISLQPNKERVKGHFIMNVVKNSLPGALTVLLFHLMVWLVTVKYPIGALKTSLTAIGSNSELYTSVLLIVTVLICILVLYRMSKPFNTLKLVVFISSCVISAICILFSHSAFLNNSLFSVNNFLKLAVFKDNEYAIYFTVICLLIVNEIFNLIEDAIYKISKIKL